MNRRRNLRKIAGRHAFARVDGAGRKSFYAKISHCLLLVFYLRVIKYNILLKFLALLETTNYQLPLLLPRP